MSPESMVSGAWWRQRFDEAQPRLRQLQTRALQLLAGLMDRGKPSLVNRLSAFLLMGTVAIYLISVGALYVTTSRSIEESMRKQAAQWLAEMDEMGTPLYFSRKAELSVIEKRIRSLPEISFVRYYDTSGKRTLGQFGQYRDQPPRPLSEAQIQTLAEIAKTDTPYLFDSSQAESNFVHVVSSVRVRSIRSDGLLNFNLADGAEDVKIIGYIDLAIDPRSYRAQLNQSIIFGSILTAIILLIAIVVGRRLIRKALHPLTELQTPLARLAKGEIDVSVVSGGDVEIAAIADALNVTIGALKQRNEALHRLAERDALTGLYNRNYFARVLDTELAWVKRGKMSSALLFIDLDRFKYVNDTLGHAAGDRLLMEVAELIKTRMRGHDVVSRFGGDEFTVVAHDVSTQDATHIAKNIHDILLDYQFVDQDQTFTISCTIGIAMITRESRDAKEVLSHADSACYEAKSGGRNRYVLYEPDETQKLTTASDIGWSQLIKDALKGDGFALVYQPIVSITGGKQEFYEVLLRIADKNGKYLMPGNFLPVAERFGLLAEIDRWVVAHALAALAEARAHGRDIVFSINLSGQAMADVAIVELIKNCLMQHALPPSTVVFEITEQTAVRNIDRARHVMHSLIELGCRFALDDFGVGFSSFNYLKRLPVGLVKIDGAFIKNLDSEPIDQVMVKSIVEIAKALGKEVVAEFVQNDATIELLKGYGVDFVQGGHLGRPTDVLPHHPSSMGAGHARKSAARTTPAPRKSGPGRGLH
jgi:diguanylate cyclase (GGDEF)-like protein